MIAEGIRNPREALFRLHWLFNRKLRSHDGIQVMDEDWDNLIILDACRYDVFEKYADIPGELHRRVSRGSHTREFMIRNFKEEEYPDTVYVSATPQLQSAGLHRQFHEFVPLWETHWDEEIQTVPPDLAVDATLATAAQYPGKRIITHLLQPHYPFIGSTGRQISHRAVSGDGIIDEAEDEHSIWEKLEEGEIDEGTVYEAYVENLKLVVPQVNRLISNISGRTVVTSDHGNAFGRLGTYGHPQRKFLKELVEIPWVVIESDERRTISEGEVDTAVDKNSNIGELLRHLGYT